MGSKLDYFAAAPKGNEGEWFTMENGLRVRATMPAAYNREYQRALANGVSIDLDSEGKPIHREEDRFARYEQLIAAFNVGCIKEIEGEKVELPLDFDKYYRLIHGVYQKANALAEAEAEKGETDVKKS